MSMRPLLGLSLAMLVGCVGPSQEALSLIDQAIKGNTLAATVSPLSSEAKSACSENAAAWVALRERLTGEPLPVELRASIQGALLERLLAPPRAVADAATVRSDVDVAPVTSEAP